MADTDKADPRNVITNQSDRDEEPAQRPPEGEETPDRAQPDDETLDLEEHLAGLWDVLGIGDEEEHKPEESTDKEESKDEEE